MFDRSRTDIVPEPSAVPVEITLVDATVLKGKLLVPVGKGLGDLLNGNASFVELEPYGGERRFLAKSQLAVVKPVGVPKVPHLATQARDSGFDPYAVLGVAAGAAFDEVRQAYHRQAKAYHPDRYASADLPAEVTVYLEAMARRINAAYAALDKPQLHARPAAGTKSAPIYTSAGSAT